MSTIDEQIDEEILQATARREKLLQLAAIEDENDALCQRLIMSQTKVSLRKIMRVTSNFFDVAPSCLMAQIRTPRAVEARQVTMFILVRKLNIPNAEVARMLKRDHATVTHSLKTVENRRDTEPDFKRCLAEVSALVEEQIK